MTEDFVVENLCRWLISQGYQIDNSCTGAKPGNDIEASKNDKKLIVEAKGAKGNLSHTTREKFDSGQIKTHLGKALVKVLEQKAIYPEAEIAIAHPHDEYLMKVMETVRPEIKKMGIKMFWVKDEYLVTED